MPTLICSQLLYRRCCSFLNEGHHQRSAQPPINVYTSVPKWHEHQHAGQWFEDPRPRCLGPSPPTKAPLVTATSVIFPIYFEHFPVSTFSLSNEIIISLLALTLKWAVAWHTNSHNRFLGLSKEVGPCNSNGGSSIFQDFFTLL